MPPIKFDPQKESRDAFRKKHPVLKTVDRYAELLEELFLIRNPKYRFEKGYEPAFHKFSMNHTGTKSLIDAGEWFYFPWNQILAHYLPDELHQELRTARNRNLITKDEQEKFYNTVVGITGLSVGSHAALTLAMMGGCRIMKLADPDLISGSNLNRIRGDFTHVGLGKCETVAHHIYQINPYAEIYSYTEGIRADAIRAFLAGPPRISVLLEQVDNPELKIRLRLEARKLGIPVIMATDNGDNIIVDIERYDLRPDLQLFNGAAGDLTLEQFQKFSPEELPRLATQIAGPDVVVPRMLKSVSEVGQTLYSWPQLGDAATLAGAALSYVVKRLALGEKVKEGRIEVNLDAIFDPDYSAPESLKERTQKRTEFLKTLGIEHHA